MTKLVIAFVCVFLLMSLRLLGLDIELPASHDIARASAFILLIAVVSLGVVELGWGGGSKKNER